MDGERYISKLAEVNPGLTKTDIAWVLAACQEGGPSKFLSSYKYIPLTDEVIRKRLQTDPEKLNSLPGRIRAHMVRILLSQEVPAEKLFAWILTDHYTKVLSGFDLKDAEMIQQVLNGESTDTNWYYNIAPHMLSELTITTRSQVEALRMVLNWAKDGRTKGAEKDKRCILKRSATVRMVAYELQTFNGCSPGSNGSIASRTLYTKRSGRKTGSP